MVEWKGKKRGRERERERERDREERDLTVSETVFLHCVLFYFNFLIIKGKKKKSSLHFGNLGSLSCDTNPLQS